MKTDFAPAIRRIDATQVSPRLCDCGSMCDLDLTGCLANYRWVQPAYTDCSNCGTVDHNDFRCPCGCHSGKRQRRLVRGGR